MPTWCSSTKQLRYFFNEFVFIFRLGSYLGSVSVWVVVSFTEKGEKLISTMCRDVFFVPARPKHQPRIIITFLIDARFRRNLDCPVFFRLRFRAETFFIFDRTLIEHYTHVHFRRFGLPVWT